MMLNDAVEMSTELCDLLDDFFKRHGIEGERADFLLGFVLGQLARKRGGVTNAASEMKAIIDSLVHFVEAAERGVGSA